MARSPSRAGTKLKLIGRPRASVVSARVFGRLRVGVSAALLIGGVCPPSAACRHVPLRERASRPATWEWAAPDRRWPDRGGSGCRRAGGSSHRPRSTRTCHRGRLARRGHRPRRSGDARRPLVQGAGRTPGACWPCPPASRRLAYDRLLGQVAAEHLRNVEVYDLGAQVCPGGKFESTVDGVRIRLPDGIHFPRDPATDGPVLPTPKWLAWKLFPEAVRVGRLQMAGTPLR